MFVMFQKQLLKNAANNLIKVRCDARYPYLAENSVDIAAFWVSLHHFTSEDLIKVIETTKKNVETQRVTYNI